MNEIRGLAQMFGNQSVSGKIVAVIQGLLRAFAEFTEAKLAERVHEALIKNYLGDTLIGHISRDGTAIAAREKPANTGTDAQ